MPAPVSTKVLRLLFMQTLLCLLSKLAYNLGTLRKPAGIVLSLLLLAALAVPVRCLAQQQPDPVRASRLLLIIPFENTSKAVGIDWISEAFCQVDMAHQNSGLLFVMGIEYRV